MSLWTRASAVGSVASQAELEESIGQPTIIPNSTAPKVRPNFPAKICLIQTLPTGGRWATLGFVLPWGVLDFMRSSESSSLFMVSSFLLFLLVVDLTTKPPSETIGHWPKTVIICVHHALMDLLIIRMPVRRRTKQVQFVHECVLTLVGIEMAVSNIAVNSIRGRGEVGRWSISFWAVCSLGFIDQSCLGIDLVVLLEPTKIQVGAVSKVQKANCHVTPGCSDQRHVHDIQGLAGHFALGQVNDCSILFPDVAWRASSRAKA